MFTTTVAIVSFAVLISAFARGLAGFGFAIAAVPILSLVITPIEAVAMAVMLQVVVGFKDIFDLRQDIHKPSLIRLALGSLVGTPIGIFALAVLNPDAARILIALTVLAGLLILVFYKPTEARPNDALATATGVASGIFSGLAAMPGPPAVAYYLGIGMPAKQSRASLLFFFFFAAVIATPGLAWAGAVNRETLWLVLVSVPALALGTWAGTQTFERLNSDQYRNIAIGVMALSGLLAGWRGVSAFI